MTIDFPNMPEPESFTPTYRDFSAVSTPPSGGVEQRIARLGDRWTVAFVMPSMAEDCVNAFIAVQTRARAEGETVRMALPRKGAAPTGVTGVGVVNAVTVAVDAASSPVPVKVGMFFDFIAEGRVYLHQVTRLDGGVLGVSPRLRADMNGALSFSAPRVEGWLATDTAWTVERLADGGASFTITEER